MHAGVSIQSLVNPRCVGLHRFLLVVVVVWRWAGLGLVQHRVVNLKLTATFLLQAPSAAKIYSLPLSVHQVNHATPLPSCFPPSLGMVKSRKEQSNPFPVCVRASMFMQKWRVSDMTLEGISGCQPGQQIFWTTYLLRNVSWAPPSLCLLKNMQEKLTPGPSYVWSSDSQPVGHGPFWGIE